MKDLLPNRLSAWKLGDGTIAFFCRESPGASSVPMMSTCTSASRELISQGPAAQPRLENAAVYDLVPLGILSGVMCLEQLLPSLIIQPHSSMKRLTAS